MDMRTPLKRVRGYGAAGEGTGHFWLQRMTAIANLFLIAFFVVLLVSLHDESYGTVRAALANPIVGLVMALVVVIPCIHMRLGMQTIIEDYFHGQAKVAMVILNTFFAFVVGAAGVFAILRMSFGA